MRWPGLLAAVMLSACGGGGGGGVALSLTQTASFGFVRPDRPTAKKFLVPNPLVVDATVEDVGGSGGPFAIVPGIPGFVGSGQSLEVPVEFTPGPAGPYETKFRFRFTGGDQQATVVLTVVAVVDTPSAALTAPSIEFPFTLIGTSSTVRAYVQNTSHATPVRILSLGPLPPEFTAIFSAHTLEAGDTLAIPITYTPKAPGSPAFDVDIGHEAGPPLTLHVTGHCETWLPETVVDFGNVTLNAGRSDWLEVDVPPHAIGVSFEMVGVDDFAFPMLFALEGPGGYVYLDEQGNGPLKWRPALSGAAFALTIPNTDRADAQLVPGGGRYRFRIQSGGGTIKTRVIIENRLDAIVDGGVIDLNVFVTPALAISKPEQDPKIATIVAGADATLEQIGLHIGQVSYFQLANTTNNNDIILTIPGFEAMLRESSKAPVPRANVFLVSILFPNQYGASLGGAAAAVPEPKVNGTSMSGVAICFAYDAQVLGVVLAHELGHALGLQHTTEPPYPGVQDDIEDTLPCPLIGTDSVCTVPGGNYLMFWGGAGQSAVITPGQARVILAHPFVDPTPPLASLASLRWSRSTAPVVVQLPPGFCGNCAGAIK